VSTGKPAHAPVLRRESTRLRKGKAGDRGSPRAGTTVSTSATAGDDEVWLLDYGAGNVRSIRNAIKHLGYKVRDVTRPEDLGRADVKKLLFPGVGAFGSAMRELDNGGYVKALREYIENDRPFLGICIGMQVLFEGSEEDIGVEGLGVIAGNIDLFEAYPGFPVPHIGWNTTNILKPNLLIPSSAGGDSDQSRVYFVHSYHAKEAKAANGAGSDWALAETQYGDSRFVSAIHNGSQVFATQFHPEKSGKTGLKVLENFLSGKALKANDASAAASRSVQAEGETLAKRVIACLDVRSNDNGDLVVTKGDQYDVREKTDSNEVRNLGRPVDLATQYYHWGADEVTFLNITGFRDFPLSDLPMLEVLKKTSEKVFVPLTVGGGIREFTDSQGTSYTSLDVASEYFKGGADKISIGSDAVYIAEDYLRNNKQKHGTTSIEQISERYGKQAVVVSIDPRRVYVADPSDVPLKTIQTSIPGPNGERYCWWECTVKGGREGRPIGAYEVAIAVEDLGAGEILLNSIDRDGTGSGFDLELVELISGSVNIPVIASSGAGSTRHFVDVFEGTRASAALAAGIFHRKEINISEVKDDMKANRIPARIE